MGANDAHYYRVPLFCDVESTIFVELNTVAKY